MQNTGNDYPRVLIISHNVMADNTSMGKTIATYFHDWDRENIAQLYFHSEVPTSRVCGKYYKFTDIDALKSIVARWHHGIRIDEDQIQDTRDDATDTGKLTGVYNFGRKRYPIIYLVRDAMWRISAWKSKDLLNWISSFDPEVVFYASGDYAFSYRIAETISKKFSIPFVACCVDDYYIYNENEDLFLGRLRHRLFMKTVRRTFERVKCIFTISEEMSIDYSNLFKKSCPILYTGARKFDMDSCSKKENRIVYLGGLSLNRYLQLVDIGRVLLGIDDNRIPKYLDVYSGETNPLYIEKMTFENGINFHGRVSGEEVAKIIKESTVIVHTESFEEKTKNRVKYSVSTKIPDSLACGTCILAYGPRGIASIDYLHRNNAAFVVDKREDLSATIIEIFSNSSERTSIINNAIALSEKNHDSRIINSILKESINKALD